ncbi:MAG: hypothetical protein Ct9H90mP5_06530 [Acidimicrobiaceae bacterium]|nr:MAG: hypothetical protein Ct9H90mP5_06530 [Acidimicrobiaceae bacterium]
MGKKPFENLDIELVRNNQFLCHYEDFAEWTKPKQIQNGRLLSMAKKTP